MMQQVMERGTGRAAHILLPQSMAVAGKSGTSSDLRDSWFAGFSGNHLIVVWVGYDDNRPTGLTGSLGALPIWTRLMAGVQPSPWAPAVPEGVADIEIDYPSGQRADARCSTDRVTVAVPASANIPVKAGCTVDSQSLLDKARNALRGIIGR
jgi:penicillin-binding protein 1B